MATTKTKFTEQEIANLSLDGDLTAGVVPMRGMLRWAEGVGWYKSPIANMFVYQQFDWTSGDLDYMGINDDYSASDDDTDWIIFKFTWSSGDVTKIQMRQTSWTNRGTGW